MEVLDIAFFGCREDERAAIVDLAPRLGVHPVVIDGDVSPSNAGRAAGCSCASVGHRARIGRRELQLLRRAGVGFVSTRSIGCDHIDLRAARDLGVEVCNSPYAPDGVADYTLALMLVALRGLAETVRAADRGDYRLQGPRSRELRDLTVGVVGTGHIGAAVIERLRGFGCRLMACDPHPSVTGVRYGTLSELLERCDVLTLHVPLTDRTRHMIGRAELRSMRPGAIVVNTARGALIDTDALVAALREKRIAAAALDVVEGEETLFYRNHGRRLGRDCGCGQDCDHDQDCGSVRDEPAVGDNLPDALWELLDLPNVILSPHRAYFTQNNLRETVQASMESCLRFAAGLSA